MPMIQEGSRNEGRFGRLNLTEGSVGKCQTATPAMMGMMVLELLSSVVVVQEFPLKEESVWNETPSGTTLNVEVTKLIASGVSVVELIAVLSSEVVVSLGRSVLEAITCDRVGPVAGSGGSVELDVTSVDSAVVLLTATVVEFAITATEEAPDESEEDSRVESMAGNPPELFELSSVFRLLEAEFVEEFDDPEVTDGPDSHNSSSVDVLECSEELEVEEERIFVEVVEAGSTVVPASIDDELSTIIVFASLGPSDAPGDLDPWLFSAEMEACVEVDDRDALSLPQVTRT